MELEEKRPRITLTQPLPVDQTASVPLVSDGRRPRWTSRLAFTWPLIYGAHIIVLITLGITIIILATVRGGAKKHKSVFWEVAPEFISAAIAIITTMIVQFIFIPKFWKNRAHEMIARGMFDPTVTHPTVYGRRIILEIGCSEGMASACFAREILAHQGNIAQARTSASLPIFIGHDRWSKWTRIPNNPTCYLETLTRIGVPRDLIRTSRVDETNSETRATLPFADNSISLVVSYLGLEEVSKWNNRRERRMLFRELARVVAVGGAMIVLENSGSGTYEGAKEELKSKSWFEGPMMSYRRLLIHELGWEEEWVQVRKQWGTQYLVARKGMNV